MAKSIDAARKWVICASPLGLVALVGVSPPWLCEPERSGPAFQVEAIDAYLEGAGRTGR